MEKDQNILCWSLLHAWNVLIFSVICTMQTFKAKFLFRHSKDRAFLESGQSIEWHQINAIDGKKGIPSWLDQSQLDTMNSGKTCFSAKLIRDNNIDRDSHFLQRAVLGAVNFAEFKIIFTESLYDNERFQTNRAASRSKIRLNDISPRFHQLKKWTFDFFTHIYLL